MFRFVSRTIRATLVAASLALTVAVVRPLPAQGIARPSMTAASQLPSTVTQPTPAPATLTRNSSMAMQHRRGAWIHLSTVAVVLGAIILVLLLV